MPESYLIFGGTLEVMMVSWWLEPFPSLNSHICLWIYCGAIILHLHCMPIKDIWEAFGPESPQIVTFLIVRFQGHSEMVAYSVHCRCQLAHWQNSWLLSHWIDTVEQQISFTYKLATQKTQIEINNHTMAKMMSKLWSKWLWRICK